MLNELLLLLLLFSGTNCNESKSVIEPELTTTESFHNITLKSPTWSADTNYKSFFEAVTKRLEHNNNIYFNIYI